ncbi:unnamed protein product [Effrenium voratum]|nr:unnamed protein product [Effrenium voratum]
MEPQVKIGAIYVKNTFLHFAPENETPAVGRSASCPPGMAKEFNTYNTYNTSCCGGPWTQSTLATAPNELIDDDADSADEVATCYSDLSEHHPFPVDAISANRLSFPATEVSDGKCAGQSCDVRGSRENQREALSLSFQKKVNKELSNTAQKGGSRILEVVERHLAVMNCLNLATAFHRLARHTENPQEVTSSSTFLRMIDLAHDFARQDCWKAEIRPCQRSVAPSSLGLVQTSTHFLVRSSPSSRSLWCAMCKVARAMSSRICCGPLPSCTNCGRSSRRRSNGKLSSL